MKLVNPNTDPESADSKPPDEKSVNAIRVRALFFALYRDLTGSRGVDWELPRDATVADLVRRIRQQGEPWSRIPEDPTIAVNLVYVRGETTLQNGDEVAFIPPVAGG